MPGVRTPERNFSGRTLLVLAAIVVVVAGLKAARPILEPLMLGVFLALLSFPVLDWLRRIGLKTRLAVGVTVLADLAVFLALALLVRGAMNQFLRQAPRYLEALEARGRELLTTLEGWGLDLSTAYQGEVIDNRRLIELAGDLVGGTVRGVVDVSIYLVLVSATLVFVLHELVALPAKLDRAVAAPGDWSRRFVGVSREVQRYLWVKTVLSLATGLVIGGWTGYLGVDFPMLWGLLAFLLNYIPFLGSIIAAFPAVLVSMVELDWTMTLLVAAGYFAVNMLIGNLVEPHLMGRQFGISAAVVLVSLLFWGWMWGALGMILSVPLTMSLKIVCEYSPRLRWLAVLIGPARGAPPPPA